MHYVSLLIEFLRGRPAVVFWTVALTQAALWTFIPVLSIIVALLALGLIAFTILAWTRRFWGLGRRIHYTLVTLGVVGFVWFMYFWNILGIGF